MKIGLTEMNKLVVNGHYLCGQTQSLDKIVEEFPVSINDVINRLQTVVKPVKRADVKLKHRTGHIELDAEFTNKLNEALMRLLAEELTQ